MGFIVVDVFEELELDFELVLVEFKEVDGLSKELTLELDPPINPHPDIDNAKRREKGYKKRFLLFILSPHYYRDLFSITYGRIEISKFPFLVLNSSMNCFSSLILFNSIR